MKETRKEKKTLIAIIFLFLNLIIMSGNIVLDNDKTLLNTTISTLVSPLQIATQKSVSFFAGIVKRNIFLKGAYKKYLDKKKENSALRYENFLLKKRLREMDQLERVKKNPDIFLIADTISIDPGFPYDFITINKGLLSGIKSGMIALNNQGQLIGKVIEPVSLLSAKIKLITSSIGGVGVYVKDKELEGLLTGKGNQLCSLNYIINRADVKLGEEVISSGTDNIYPYGLPVGVIIKTNEKDLEKNIVVKPYWVSEPIKEILIIKKDEK